MTDGVAIVVPAYKRDFLARALTSLARLEGACFHVYVFDDASPHGLEPIVRQTFRSSACRWSYHRFERNLGGHALVQHYARCIENTTEPWIWLFSDDDEAGKSCVSAFSRTVADTRSGFDVYCYNSVAIDARDRVTALHPPLPVQESWKHFAYHFFAGHRTIPQQAIIFSRAAFGRIGGFVDFPLGWTSDQATLMALAGTKGIRKIEGAQIRFRYSGQNISSASDRALAMQKLRAAMQFVEWTLSQMDRIPDPAFTFSDALLREQAFAWFRGHLSALKTWYAPAQCMETARFLSRMAGEPYAKALGRMAKLDLGMLKHTVRGMLTSAAR